MTQNTPENQEEFREALDKLFDQFWKEKRIVMRLEKPAGTLDIEVTTNLGDRMPNFELYMLMMALQPIYQKFREGLNVEDEEAFLDDVLGDIKTLIMAGIDKGEGTA